MGVRWEYEPEGYTLLDGSYYLPDFKLYDVGVYFTSTANPQESALFVDDLPPFFVEVKPTADQFRDACCRLIQFFTDPIIVLNDEPFSCAVAFAGKSDDDGRRVAASSLWMNDGRGIGLLFISHGKTVRDVLASSQVASQGYRHQTITYAKLLSRQARFEHGKNGRQ